MHEARLQESSVQLQAIAGQPEHSAVLLKLQELALQHPGMQNLCMLWFCFWEAFFKTVLTCHSAD